MKFLVRTTCTFTILSIVLLLCRCVGIEGWMLHRYQKLQHSIFAENDRKRQLESDIVKRLSQPKDMNQQGNNRRRSYSSKQVQSPSTQPHQQHHPRTYSAKSSSLPSLANHANEQFKHLRNNCNSGASAIVQTSAETTFNHSKIDAPKIFDLSTRRKWSFRNDPQRQRADQLHSISDQSRSRRRSSGIRAKNGSTLPFSSLLPPMTQDSAFDNHDGADDPLTTGLSSWEEFLGVRSLSNKPSFSIPSPLQPAQYEHKKEESISEVTLPPIHDLFPPNLTVNPPSLTSSPLSSSSSSSSSSSPFIKSNSNSIKDKARSRFKKPPSSLSLDSVVPVSDLFYRPTESNGVNEPSSMTAPLSRKSSRSSRIDRQSLKQEYPITTKDSQQEMALKRPAAAAATTTTKSRKMIRRGMEMLVGGVPIHADPPHRCVELSYIPFNPPDWARTISISTLDFGPMLHTSSISSVTRLEQGLFLEHYCHSALKWNICPKDLREIIRSNTRQALPTTEVSALSYLSLSPAVIESNSVLQSNSVPPFDTSLSFVAPEVSVVIRSPVNEESHVPHHPPTHDEEDDEYNEALSIQVRPREPRSTPLDDKRRQSSRRSTSALSKAKDSGRKKHERSDNKENDRQVFDAVTELVFDLSVPRVDLESGDQEETGQVLKTVLCSAFRTVCFEYLNGFVVDVSKLVLDEKDVGTTGIDVEFKISNERPMSLSQVQKRLKRISAAFLQAVDEGVMLLAIAKYAKLQPKWSLDTRERVAEDCLREESEPDDLSEDLIANYTTDDKSLLSRSPLSREDLFVGSGKEGLFPDYSESNRLNSPYKGEIGFRLWDAVSQRAKECVPRVIVIGDVHGCVDELQDLLRQCDYRPGDLVVFLGDLVCKGPDSTSVVQMAREIGAIGVRGNHDFEVIRWHQAIKSGVEPPVVGSEHFHIASCLNKADMKWMCTLPWFMSSKDLGTLFVHAGFVSGIRLAKQNPRLLMNMRSILPDGTVTSKFFNNWPWARLWDGPQTVLFGHDADRGLQQYEHAIGLDTGCVYGGRLTACILPEKKLVSVSARREYFKYRRKHYD